MLALLELDFILYMKITGNVKYRDMIFDMVYTEAVLSVQRGSQFHIVLMRFANFAANTSIPANESENFPRSEDARLVDRVSASARSCLFATDYKHWESKGKRATKTEERYLLLLRWISFHGILSNSIQSPPLRKALSVSPPSDVSPFLSPSLLRMSCFSVFTSSASSSTYFSANYWFVS